MIRFTGAAAIIVVLFSSCKQSGDRGFLKDIEDQKPFESGMIQSLRECPYATPADVAKCALLIEGIAAAVYLGAPGALGTGVSATQALIAARLSSLLHVTITTKDIQGWSIIGVVGSGVSCVSFSDWVKMVARSTGMPQAVSAAISPCLSTVGDYAAGCIAVADLCMNFVTGGPVTRPVAGDTRGVSHGRKCIQKWNFNPFTGRCSNCSSCCASLPINHTGGCHAVCNAQYNCKLPVDFENSVYQ